jgi:hypothetical protein
MRMLHESNHIAGDAQLPWPVPWTGVSVECVYDLLESPMAVRIRKHICCSVVACVDACSGDTPKYCDMIIARLHIMRS